MLVSTQLVLLGGLAVVDGHIVDATEVDTIVESTEVTDEGSTEGSARGKVEVSDVKDVDSVGGQ